MCLNVRRFPPPSSRIYEQRYIGLKSRPGPLSSSTVVTPPFIPSGAPPWDSRPVSGAGVVHYHSLHRPRSVPTALGPAPLVTGTKGPQMLLTPEEEVAGELRHAMGA